MGKKSVFITACAVALSVACSLTGAYWYLYCRDALSRPAAPVGLQPDTDRLTLVFTGDLMQHLPQVQAAVRRDGTIDYTACFSRLKNYFSDADFVISNLETTLGDPPYLGYPCFRAPVALAGAMRSAGIDVAALANNHICDQGGKGIRSTVGALREAGLRSTGAYADTAAETVRQPVVLEKNGFRVALFNYTYGTNGLPVPAGCAVNRIDTLRMRGDIASARAAGATHVALLLHWGNEYEPRPNAAQRSLAAWCHRQGADWVIGSHPHVVQSVETVADGAGSVRGVTVFSMGNFVSNQRMAGTDGSISVRLTLRRAHDGSVACDPEYLIHWTCISADPGSLSGRRYEVVPAFSHSTVPEGCRSGFDRFVSRTRDYMSRYSSGFKEIVDDYRP